MPHARRVDPTPAGDPVLIARLGWPAALALAVAVVPAGFALVLGTEFVAAALLGDRHWRGLARAWVGEVGASMRTFLCAVPFPGGRELRYPQGERTPVVLVHGYLCNRAVWRVFARRLAAAGHPCVAVDLEPPFGPIEAHVATIARAVARAGAGRPVVLVGHSMGGLAIRAYLREAGPAGIAGVVTLGSPHRGTRAAALGRTPAARQMRRGSQWLEALAAHEANRAAASSDAAHAATPPVCVVLTRNDNIVYPQSGQAPPGARVLPLEGVGHLDLVYRRSVWRLVQAEIARLEG